MLDIANPELPKNWFMKITFVDIFSLYQIPSLYLYSTMHTNVTKTIDTRSVVDSADTQLVRKTKIWLIQMMRQM